MTTYEYILAKRKHCPNINIDSKDRTPNIDHIGNIENKEISDALKVEEANKNLIFENENGVVSVVEQNNYNHQ